MRLRFLCLFVPPPASRLPRFPASCFPAFLLSCFLASFPLFSFLSSFPSFPSVPPSPLFAAFAGASGFLSALDGMAWERSMPGCRLASACRFLGGWLRGYPGFRPLSDGGCGKGSSAGPLMWAAARVRLSAGPGLWREPRRGAYWRVGPRHGDGTAGHEKSTVPQCEGRCFHFAFCWLGRAVFRQRVEAFPAAVGCHRLSSAAATLCPIPRRELASGRA